MAETEDEIERLIDEMSDRPMSGEEMEAAFARLDTALDRRDEADDQSSAS